MKKLKPPIMVLLTVLLILPGIHCLSLFTTVIQKNDNSAIISGIGNSPTEAKITAEKRAYKLFADFVHTKESECHQEYVVSGMADQYSGQVSGGTTWNCVIFVSRK